MVNTNKVLTVSYGTFSCTLEGFDDSFEMMKAVAEYFRDLASDDRYFGAEPPSLDADTLAHIAARGTRHKISARKEGENVVLAPMTTDDETVTAPQTNVVPAASIAERLHRIRSVVETADESPYSENEHVEDVAATKSIQDVFDEPSQDIALGGASADTLEADLSEPEQMAATDHAPVQTDAQEASAEAASAKEDALPIDTVQTLASDGRDHANADTATDQDASDPQVSSGAADQADNTAVEIDDIALEQDIADTVEAKADDAKALDPHIPVDNSSELDETDGLPVLDDIDFEDSLAAALGEEKPLTAETQEFEHPEKTTPATVDFEDALASALGDEDNATEAKAGSSNERKPRVHVIKLAKAEPAHAEDDADQSDDLDAELANIMNDDAETDTAQDVGTETDTNGNDTTYVLGPDLAVNDADADETLDTEQETAVPQPVTPRRVKASSDTSHQRTDSLLRHERQDVSRLMQETDEKLSNPASNRRRNALAHLRAAVAATMADKSIETAGRKDDNSDVYREDLATVVRPRRPDTRKLRSEIDEPSKTTPLRLVAEQRVDPVDDIKEVVQSQGAQTQDARVSHEPNPEEFETFEDYSEAIGALNLEDKLEAAASFLFFVKGFEGFTRPQLMNTVKRSSPDEFSREDGLRGFGELIRSGKIRRKDGGMFEASEDIGFHPNELKAG